MRISTSERGGLRWRQWLAWVALTLLLSATPIVPALAGNVVRGMSLAASASGAALRIDLSHATRYRLFTLAHPRRVVIDFSHARLLRSVRVPRAAGVIDAIRKGRRPDGGLRLVLQLHSALPARAYWTSPRRGAAPQLVVIIGRASSVARRVTALASPRSMSAQPARSERLRPPTIRSRQSRLTLTHSLPLRPQQARSLQVTPRAVPAVHAPLDIGRDIIVAVDAGHGGQDPGAIGPDGLEEKTVTLAIARALAARIDAEPGMRAVLTRNRDIFLPLRERLRIARAAKADLFVSIHADSVHDEAVSGSSVYVLSLHGATDEAARWLAERENAADLIGGVSLANKGTRLASVLLDLSQSASISASMTAAEGVLGSLERVAPVCKTRVQQAAFVVLKSPDIPSMLVETAYISNPADERRLRNPRSQRRLADAIFTGLRRYFEQHPPTGTRFALERAAGADGVLAGASGGPATSLPR